MKYVLLIYGNPTNWKHPVFLQDEGLSQDERDARRNQFDELCQEITESGELIECQALADPVNTKTVQLRADTVQATDGPFLESKEHLAGFFVVDCDSLERAVEIAAGFPDARLCPIEVRAIMDMSGPQM